MSTPAAARPTVPWLEYALLLVLATLWGGGFSLIKLSLETIPPITTITLRTAIAGIVLFSLMRMRGLAVPRDLDSWKSFATVSMVNTVVPFVLIAWGLMSVDASLGIILNSTTPIFAFLLTWGVTRHEAVTGRKLFGVIAGIAGILMIVGTEALSGVGRQILPQLSLVAASLSYACSAIYGRTFRDMNPLVPAACSLSFGALVLAPFAIVLEQPWTIRPSPTSITALVVLGVVGTALGNVLYFRLLGTLGSLGAISQSYLRVPMGVLAGMVLLGERLSPTGWFGLVCVVLGVAAMTVTAPLPWLETALDRARIQAVAALDAARPLAWEYVLLLVVSVLWAGSYVWVKIGLETVPPLTLMAGRIVVAGLFLLTIAHITGRRLPTDPLTWRMCAVQGALATVLPFSLVAWGQQWVDAGPTAILNSVSPVFVFLITWAITRHEPATATKLVGVVAGLGGVLMVMGPAAIGGLGKSVWPQVAIVLSSLSYAVGAIFARNFRAADPVTTAATAMICASALIVPLALVCEPPWTYSPSWTGLKCVLALGVLSTGLGFMIYFRLSRTLGAMGVSAQSYLRAPIGVLLGAVLLGEAVTLPMLGGMLLVVIGIAAMTLPASAPKAPA